MKVEAAAAADMSLMTVTVTRGSDSYQIGVKDTTFKVNGQTKPLPFFKTGLFISTAADIYVVEFMDLTVSIDKTSGIHISARPSVYSTRVCNATRREATTPSL